MDKELKKKLLGKYVYSSDTEVEYIPDMYSDDEIPEEYKLKVTLKSLTTKEKIDVVKLMSESSFYDLVKKGGDILRKKITNIENLYDLGTEELIEFRKDDKGWLHYEVYNMIPQTVCGEILSYLLTISGLSDVKKKP